MAGLKSDLLEILARQGSDEYSTSSKAVKGILHDENELEEFLEAFKSPFRATLLKAPAAHALYNILMKCITESRPVHGVGVTG